MKKEKSVIENLIMFLIFMVMIQTFLDDFSVIMDLPWQFRKILIITGFVFDLLFTLEFLVRFFNAALSGKGEISRYFFKRRGWIDFAASLPLLLLNSGPAFFALYTGMAIGGFAGVLNVLKVVKAVRIARILRLLRVLKIFKQIKFADSVMVQNHSAKIVTIAVTSIILPITLMSLLFSMIHLSDVEEHFTRSHLQAAAYIARDAQLYSNGDKLKLYCEGQTSFLILRKEGQLLYNRYDQSVYDRYFGNSDYGYIEEGDFQFFIDLRPMNRSQSWNNLVIFVTVIFVLIMLMVFYSPYFAIHVSDPVNIMRKGMSEKGYHLQVAIPQGMEKDDLFQLARYYNEEYLPLKMRSQQEEEGSGLELNMDDFEDLFKI